MKRFLSVCAVIVGSMTSAWAMPVVDNSKTKLLAPTPTTCVTGTFDKNGTGYWAEYTLKLTNNCGKAIDFQNASITFKSNTNLDTNFWGTFDPLSYPDGTMQITSQTDSPGFLSSLLLHFSETWGNSSLPDQGSFTITYGTVGTHIPTSALVYTSTVPPVVSGEIDFTNTTTQPAKVSQTYAVVNLLMNGEKVSAVEVPWGGTLAVDGLIPGDYTLQPLSVTDTDSNLLEGTATPATVTVVADRKVATSLKYEQVAQSGTINVKAPAIPAAIASYSSIPSITFTRADTGTSITKSVPWNATTAVTTLANNVTYKVTTPTINYNNVNCVGVLSPSSLASSSTSPLTTQLSYTCKSVAQDKITLKAIGLPCDTKVVTVFFVPVGDTTTTTQTLTISSGSGSGSVNLTDGVVYNVSTTTIAGYSPTYSVQPLMAKPDVTEVITFAPVPKK